MRRRRIYQHAGGCRGCVALSRACSAVDAAAGFSLTVRRWTPIASTQTFSGKGLAEAGLSRARDARIERALGSRRVTSSYPRLQRARAMACRDCRAPGEVRFCRRPRRARAMTSCVFTIGADPVGFGCRKSTIAGVLMSPGSSLSSVLGARRVALLHEIARRASRIALLMNPSNRNARAEQEDAESGHANSALKRSRLREKRRRDRCCVRGTVARAG